MTKGRVKDTRLFLCRKTIGRNDTILHRAERVIVVGGGAAGLIAAGRAAACGASVLLIEKTGRLGNKLRLAGGGKPNLSNDCDLATFIRHVVPDGRVLYNALARFGPAELRRFFAERGLPLEVQASGRLLPARGGGHDVVNVLRDYCLEHGVTFRYDSRVTGICVEDGQVTGIEYDGGHIGARAVVLATGGCSYPETGSSGDGYDLAHALDHSVTERYPGLVGLVTAQQDKSLQGVSLYDVAVKASRDGRVIARGRGDVVFGHFGLSGPAILNLSNRVSAALAKGELELTLDLLPDRSEQQLDGRIQQLALERGGQTVKSALQAWMPVALCDALLHRASISSDLRLGDLAREKRQQLIGQIKGMSFSLRKTRPMAEAMLTVGGVACSEITPHVGSRRVRGLYFAGEILDVAGDSGGYNLQIAFTTGWVAGEEAADRLMGEGVDR